MDRHRWSRLRSLFEEASTMPEGERAAFVAQQCGDDGELAAAVLRMLAADGAPHSYLDAEMLDAPAQSADAPSGTLIGAYRIGEELGRGGMGVVYRATRADGAFDREVALKVILDGVRSEEVLARFRAERRILGNLEHPNIGRLYDAGVTSRGQPYLVMEYVEGTRIDRFCDEHDLPLSERVAVFRQVCDAVEHAHRALVIHRDLKPTNVLVATDGTVKLLDFGIAKLAEGAGPDPAAPKTLTGALLFTPGYASPEQLRGEALTTSTDVYSLGALLYELLTGRRPFDDLASAAAWAAEADTAVEPPRPSDVLARGESVSPDGTRPTDPTATRRGVTPPVSSASVRGDLDLIVMRALGRSPTDRYRSVRELSDDLTRFLDGRPISVRPPSVGYRARMFARRHRVAVGAAAAVVVALSIGGGVALAQARAAAAEREVLLGVSTFLEDLFRAPDPRVSGVQDTTRMVDFLDRSADRVRTELDAQPRTKARMLLVLGSTYYNIGRSDRASRLLEEAVRAHRAAYGPSHPDLAETQRLLGMTLSDVDRYEDAVAYVDSALAIQIRASGPTSEAVARIRETLGQVHLSEGEVEAAIPHLEASLRTRRELLPPDDPAIGQSLNTLGALHSRRGRDDLAVPLFREAIERSVRAPDAVPEDIGVQRMNLAMVFIRTGRGREALEEARLGHAILEENPRTGVVARSRARLAEALAMVWRESGDEALAAEADSLFRSAVELMLSQPQAADARYLLHAQAGFLSRRGEWEDAEAAMRRALELAVTALGPEHEEAFRLRASLAQLLVDAGRPVEGESLGRQAYEGLSARLPAGHPAVVVAATALATALTALERPADASALLEPTVRAATAMLGEDHPVTAQARAALTRATEASR